MRESLVGAYLRSAFAMVFPSFASWERSKQPGVSLRGSGEIVYGRRTYWTASARFIAYGGADRIEIGNYCSVASGVRILSGGDHDLNNITTYPLEILGAQGGPEKGASSPGLVRVGNDVWIGTNALVLGGTVIGDGAVIGAGSVVTRDVPAYAVAVGAPAQVVRYRFPPVEREMLMRLRWWDWPEAAVLECADLLQSGDTAALRERALRLGLSDA